MYLRTGISKTFIGFLALISMATGCTEQKGVLYRSDNFTVYRDRVVQGPYEARVESPAKIISTYRSTASENFSRLITFKFSINEKDNEARPGADHRILIGEEHSSPVIVFGSMEGESPDAEGLMLPVNYSYTFRLDFRPVLKAFEEKGYYEAWDGSRIASQDFKGVFIAGDARPLSWDFVNLASNGLELKDPDGDGIYELTVVLNPFDEKSEAVREWKLEGDLSARPSYSSDQPLVDALFALSLEEMQKNIEADSTFRTGSMWGGVWTRDVSYSTLLALAVIEPDVAKISLMHKVKRGRIIQDTGSGGAWPVSSDRLTWALAAWEIYKYTGDRDWLEKVYPIIKNSLDDDEHTIRDSSTGLNHGESSFLDWREQTYPKWMDNADIYHSENLGTNVVHYQANRICAEMAALLGEPGEAYLLRAEEIRKGINKELWMEDAGYYGQYTYGRSYPILSPRFEALGEALAVLFGVAGKERAGDVLSSAPLTPFGVTCIYPQIPGIPPYHNNAIWPFVQSYWNLAAARVGNEEVLNHGLAAIYRPAALFLSNYENFVATNGDFVGTEINSDRMLWSMSGNMAMVLRVFMGMSFEANGIAFQPAIPEAYAGRHHLSSFRYRDMILDISVNGFGNSISTISLDGNVLESPFIADSLKGEHTIVIELRNESFSGMGMNLVDNVFSLPNPQAIIEDGILSWNPVPGARNYRVYRNGSVLEETIENKFTVDNKLFGEYMVTAMDSLGHESFACDPRTFVPEGGRKRIETEAFAPASAFPSAGYSGKGYVRIAPGENRDMRIPISVEEEGNYLLFVRYANGTGPWNTDNNCAIRTLYVNGEENGVLVFPQRGTGEWADWGLSNQKMIRLKKGRNELQISFESWNTNMDGEINEALLDYLELVKL